MLFAVAAPENFFLGSKPLLPFVPFSSSIAELGPYFYGREGREEREREGRIEEMKRMGTEDRIVGPHQHFKQIDAYGHTVATIQ